MSDVTPNTICRRLKAGQILIGGWIQIPHPAIAHLMASSGFDWLAVDVEHGVVDLTSCAEIINLGMITTIAIAVKITPTISPVKNIVCSFVKMPLYAEGRRISKLCFPCLPFKAKDRSGKGQK